MGNKFVAETNFECSETKNVILPGVKNIFASPDNVNFASEAYGFPVIATPGKQWNLKKTHVSSNNVSYVYARP